MLIVLQASIQPLSRRQHVQTAVRANIPQHLEQHILRHARSARRILSHQRGAALPASVSVGTDDIGTDEELLMISVAIWVCGLGCLSR